MKYYINIKIQTALITSASVVKFLVENYKSNRENIQKGVSIVLLKDLK